MGSNPSKNNLTQEERIALIMMPVYYIAGASPQDADVTQKSWKQIVDGTAPPYLEEQKNPKFSLSASNWFNKIFFDRLFELNPSSRSFFTQSVQNSRVLEKMIHMVTTASVDENFGETLRNVVVKHCEKGIKAVEYGTMGEALLYALGQALGPLNTPEVVMAWRKQYSEILRLTIPVIIEYERAGGKYSGNAAERDSSMHR